MKSKGRRKLEPREHQNSFHQPPIFRQALFLFRQQPVELFQKLELLQLFFHLSEASYGIVVGKSHNIELAFFSLF